MAKRGVNKHSYDTKKIQAALMPILMSFDAICREQNLTYYLWAGTQLGAVRHQGFIPWDDDVDVAMPRKDYDIFMQKASEWLPSNLELADSSLGTKNYPHYFARLHNINTTMVIRKHVKYLEGVHVDIFPLDNVPNSASGRLFHFSGLYFYHKLLYYASRNPHKNNKRFKVLFYSVLQRFFKRDKMLLVIHKYMQRCNNRQTKYCTDSFYRCSQYTSWDILGKAKVYKFEGQDLLGVEHADKYLSDKYGDYMSIPPKNARVQHRIDYLDLDSPFAEFDFEGFFK